MPSPFSAPVRESDEVDVSSDMYEETEIADQVDIYLFKGKLDIPWFVIDKN